MFVATASWDKTPRLYNAETLELEAKLTAHGDYVIRTDFSYDGQLVGTASRDGTAAVHRVDDHTLVTSVRHGMPVLALCFSPINLLFATGSNDNSCAIWDAETGQKMATFVGHTNYVARTTFSADGSTLVSGSYDGTIRVWDATTSQILSTWGRGVHEPGFDRRPKALQATNQPGPMLVYSGDGRGNFAIWDEREKTPVFRQGLTHDICDVSLSPDGNMIAIGCTGPEYKIMDLRTRAIARQADGGAGRTTSICWSPSGDHIATAMEVEGRQALHLRDSQTDQIVASSNVSTGLIPGLAMTGILLPPK